MAFEFKLPDVGEGTTEGEIIRWLVQPGDLVVEDQPVVEVQTDKALVELPSPRAGRVEAIYGEPGQVVAVGSTLLVIADGASGTPEPVREAAAPVSEVTPSSPRPGAAPPASGTPAPRVQAAPATRRLAQELGVDLTRLSGTGPKGRIVPGDVRREGLLPREAPAETAGPGRTLVPWTGLRRATALHLSQAWRDVPHVTVVDKVRADRLVALRDRLNEPAANAGVRITYLPLAAKAIQLAVALHPRFNARWEGTELYEMSRVDLGVAMDTPEGLVVPVVRDVAAQSVVELATALNALRPRAAERRLRPDELSGSTITVTGGGPLGGLMATPLINVPEVAIIGLYRIRDEAWVRDGALEAGKSLYLSLTFDHRVADGAAASAFLQTLLGLLEAPDRWLLRLR